MESFVVRTLIQWVIVLSFITWRAYRMGYNPILWFFVCILLDNHVVTLALLAGLPDRSIERKRKKDMEILEQQLAQKGLLKSGSKSLPLSRQTISDDVTVS